MNYELRLQELTDQLINTAYHFRLGQEADGSKKLRECLNIIEPMIETLDADIKSKILKIIPPMLTAQENHDWLALADFLEYEIPILLRMRAAGSDRERF
ncbi:hypothetical protein ACRN97_06960 [Shewanella baltica]|uniref:hypothetical protein n=1 Tax=Shewanella TaxID=22 RepID=UPI0021D8A905|nr:hypothetical protein [Shewanella sp. SM69]MCU8040222.1 hypothetical protein [Shewanella sp. SM69]